ncbi:bifunctional 23S rRNA (guanine(2069)-N(7))-methyltransferase RlmK/23S rRNA (guanine(2445)-N(2))-methyltransferase RlmL [Adhaeretor mobilis]|uniref:Ribosomal RNA large subunit methyltransferase K/L n=1 Tax=Adhaeretor mobilis TaxID=1930276 RepID=A0A517MUL4_9BACT|nr:bifunctional 23S rRNA (guanine(2069)-N(7))-methyltransferase RlmK/23S rRNA (guanine(2445)-N(2))-methyltransferase RlmL [Adhaeretor mobilis]QDS98568.1 Ribosomal RNA large subunit methyltransferase K/L [Adhaeretor mobilis]
MNLIATAAFGLEAIVVRELKALGYEAKVIRPGRIGFQGDASAIARANLWLRCSDRVLVELANFPAADFDALFDQTKALDWETWMTADAEIPVRGRSRKSQLTSVPAVQRTVKKAIVERLQSQYGSELPETGPSVPVEISIVEDQASLDMDTTGHGLHRRGYRKLAAEAQLRETLAAALVQLSFWKPGRPLVDPFCGTGTIVIEAAMQGRNLAPGRNRDFLAEQWPAISGEVWKVSREEAADLALPNLEETIIGWDKNAEVLSLARYHAEQAGVAGDIHFQQAEFIDLTSKRDYGCLITNPPYGERMGWDDEIEALYESMPEVFRRLKTWSHYVLTSRSDFEKLLGQKADRRRKLFNAQIECTYYQFYGPRPPRDGSATPETSSGEDASESVGRSPRVDQDVGEEVGRDANADQTSHELRHEAEEARTPPSQPAPAFGGLPPEAKRQAEEFANRLKKRARHLRRWPKQRGIGCYRLYERDIPEIPLVVDRYEDALHMAEFERPHERTPAEHADWLDLMAKTASKALEIERSQVFMKHRARQRGTDQYQRVGNHSFIKTVEEAGLKFKVNLSDFLDTGLFLDHRVTRSMVREQAEGKRFLNLFAYTGSFSVYAAAGGALETVTVDLSQNYLDWAAENMQLNDFTGPQHQFVAEDTLEFLDQTIARGDEERFGLVVVDPPTFSNSKRLDRDWDVQRDHVELLQKTIAVTSPGGVIYFSTNSRRFKFDAAAVEGATSREISKQTVPEDFRNRRIHRCWRIVKG